MIGIHSATARRNPPRHGPTGGHDETLLDREPRRDWTVRRGAMRRGVRAALVVVALVLPCLTTHPAAAEDAKAEAAAEQAIEKAGTDYGNRAYGKALYRLGKALRGCGKSGCASATVAALVRDSGSIRARRHDKKSATRLFTRAIGLASDLELSPTYDSPDVREVWEAAGGKKKPEPPPPSPPAPAAFAHTPAAAQAADTPLPVYVEGGPDTLAKVVVEYAAPGPSPAWKETVLDRVGSGWGGDIPCADVTAGTERYFVEGFDANANKVATAGSADHPFEVPVQATIAIEPPHLPGQPPPKTCAPPAAPAEPVADAPATHDVEEPATAKPSRPWRRWWVGVAADIDFMSVPSGDDLCVRNASTLQPTNGDHLYCTTLDGVDFPPQSIIDGVQGDILPGRGQGGHSDGGIQLGDVRFMATVDFALTANALIGARVGFLIHQYEGHDASRDKRAFGAPFHGELRATWLFGHEPLAGTKLAPLLFVAGGISEFDAHVKSNVTVMQGSAPNQTQLVVPVDIWTTDGPGFVGVGAGIRLGIGGYAAVIPAIRGSVAFGYNGIVPVWGPELTVQIGF